MTVDLCGGRIRAGAPGVSYMMTEELGDSAYYIQCVALEKRQNSIQVYLRNVIFGNSIGEERGGGSECL